MIKIKYSRLTKALKSNDEAYPSTYYGFCLSCGHCQNGHEPDATEDTCKKCGQNKVDGAEWILMCGNFADKGV